MCTSLHCTVHISQAGNIDKKTFALKQLFCLTGLTKLLSALLRCSGPQPTLWFIPSQSFTRCSSKIPFKKPAKLFICHICGLIKSVSTLDRAPFHQLLGICTSWLPKESKVKYFRAKLSHLQIIIEKKVSAVTLHCRPGEFSKWKLSEF